MEYLVSSMYGFCKMVGLIGNFTKARLSLITNISSVVEFLKMMGPKMQAFCPRIDMLKGNRCIFRIQGAPVHQK